MLKFFRCPDGVTRPIAECLAKCPRKEGRCLALSHLTFIGTSQRIWEGMASVTQLIKPTRLAWLEIVKDYAVNPDDMAFMMYGSLHHKRLEIINKQLGNIAEKRLTFEISGALDCLEPDELNIGFYKMFDYKLVGAYSVAKAIGLMKVNGENADPDAREWELQLNKYRLLLESDTELSKLFPISRLIIQATVRDGGLRQIEELKLPCRMPMIPIKKLPDDEVNEYFLTKDYALQTALKTMRIPEICPFTERWSGRRCRGYCSVVNFCREGAMVAKVPYLGD